MLTIVNIIKEIATFFMIFYVYIRKYIYLCPHKLNIYTKSLKSIKNEKVYYDGCYGNSCYLSKCTEG